ncbi:alpha/beta hydrolase [Paucibacter sp. R3-3]|uniref:Alpha/beta hydrolase n=1 Tax=Roseateles agri TaxID=3098619 RepID=A0ABU5DGB0_9BURK|nr:alpha/beta hydrolase [Paucibacter sp. R3-3]MDY0745325.1 alpha/beta hydrolase [Paucibacter sp. R3-3]
MNRFDPDWLDAQYNNRARVADSLVMLERWTRASALVRQGVRCELDIRYAEDGDPASTLDVFPTDVPDAPVLVFIHGGWWRVLDKSDHSFVAPVFTEAGAMVVVPNYALCPRVGIEHIALQLTQAIAWAWRHAREHGGDPNRIVLVGHSAGGHLTAMLSCCDWKTVGRDLPRGLVKGAMSISGVHDLEPVPQIGFLAEDLRLDAERARRLSPIHFPPPPLNLPFHALVGADESEEFRRQTRAIRDAWGGRAVPVCEEVPGTNHYTVLHDLADPQGRCHALTRQLLGLRWYSGLQSAPP